MRIPRSALRFVPIAVASVLGALGCVWAFDRGSPDFAVFMHAGELIRAGKWSELYVNSPDRYLYAPAFAWIVAPLAALPRALALTIWCALKLAALGWIARCLFLGVREHTTDRILWILGLGMIVTARPLLVELQYGQINLLVLASLVWALSQGGRLSWFFATVAALTKLMALPVLGVPLLRWAWARHSQTDARARTRILTECMGIALGFVLMFGIPLAAIGPVQTLELHHAWRSAVAAKGLPLESHNQSVAASIERWFSAEPTHVIALGPTPIAMTIVELSAETRTLLSWAWTCFALGLLLSALIGYARTPSLEGAAWLLAVLVLPLYLVWKPYFIFELPLVMMLLHKLFSSESSRKTRNALAFLLVAMFVINNLTSFDVLGLYLGARLEARSILMIGLGILLYGTQRLSSSPLTPIKLGAG